MLKRAKEDQRGLRRRGKGLGRLRKIGLRKVGRRIVKPESVNRAGESREG